MKLNTSTTGVMVGAGTFEDEPYVTISVGGDTIFLNKKFTAHLVNQLLKCMEVAWEEVQ